MPYLKREADNPEPIDCKILTASLDLFVNNGYHNVSVHEVQKLADVSIGSIYNHFGGKDGIAKELYDHIINELDELVDGIASESLSPLAQIKELIKQLCEHTETHAQIISFAFHTKHSEFLDKEAVISKSSPFDKLDKLVEAAVEQGELHTIDTLVASSVIYGGLIRMIQLRLDGVIEKSLADYYPIIISSLLDGFVAEKENSVAVSAVS